MDNQKKSFGLNQIVINMVMNVIAFILNMGISFFITPYITAQFGSEAYGYVKLANDFANYASIISIALNSMASRFLMIELANGNTINARKYYSSIMLSNIILSAILLIPSLLCVIFIDKICVVPVALILEVRITFALTFLAFLFNLIFSTYSNCFYLTNRLDRSAISSLLSNIIKVAVIIGLFSFFKPKISYVSVGAFASTLFVCLYNAYNKKKLLPQLFFSFSCFDLKKVLEVLSSGIWNSITRLSQIFSSGLDLLVTNLLVGPLHMGYLSIAKTVPTMLTSFNATVANIFSPNLMHLYAESKFDELKKLTKTSMGFMCLFTAIPNAILISMGKEFFDLWVPTQPSTLINTLSILTVINSVITGPMQPLYQIFTITNRVRQNSIVLILYGFTSILITYILLKTTNLGVYAVAGVSLVGSVFVALIYHLPFSAKLIGFSWHTFFPEVGKSIISLIVVTVVGYVVNVFSSLDTWIAWFIGAIVTAIIGLILNFIIVLNSDEKKHLVNIIKSKIRH